MAEMMIERPDGTLCPCTEGPSAANSSTIDNRTRAALNGSVMDGLYNSFDAGDPLSQFTQVADAGNVMSDGVEEASTGREAIPMLRKPGVYTFLDKPFATTIPLEAPNAPYASIEEAVKDAAAEIRELARNYYTDYDEIPRDWMLPEVGVVFVKLGPDQFGYDEAVIGNVVVTQHGSGVIQEGETRYDKPRSAKFAGRMHFHWRLTFRSPDDWKTALADAAFTAGESESWVALYDGATKYFPPQRNRGH